MSDLALLTTQESLLALLLGFLLETSASADLLHSALELNSAFKFSVLGSKVSDRARHSALYNSLSLSLHSLLLLLLLLLHRKRLADTETSFPFLFFPNPNLNLFFKQQLKQL